MAPFNKVIVDSFLRKHPSVFPSFSRTKLKGEGNYRSTKTLFTVSLAGPYWQLSSLTLFVQWFLQCPKAASPEMWMQFHNIHHWGRWCQEHEEKTLRGAKTPQEKLFQDMSRNHLVEPRLKWRNSRKGWKRTTKRNQYSEGHTLRAWGRIT